MMWHFYEIPYIPDLELVKYQSLGEQGIDGILERHNRFLRQWQRNTVLIHTTLHFFLSYTHERPKGSRLQIFLAFSSDQTVNFESIDTLTQKANSGDAVAMRKLGYEYLIGKNIQKDEKKAFQLFRAAVWEGDLNATIYCGYCCKTGAGLEKPNIVAAARYYEYGARAGVAAAQYELARIYLDKDMGDACFVGGANPYIGCERWLKKAAEQNYIYAEELLADKYYEGVYIVKDVKAAIYWYEKAANQGSVYAMYRAGYIYYSEPIDYNKAGQWFSLAAEKGDKDAEEVLRNNLRYNRFTKKWDAVR